MLAMKSILILWICVRKLGGKRSAIYGDKNWKLQFRALVSTRLSKTELIGRLYLRDQDYFKDKPVAIIGKNTSVELKSIGIFLILRNLLWIDIS